MKLMFVADGPRDEASLPGLVENILGQTVTPEFSAWAHLRNSGRGLERKLRFAAALTQSKRLNGLVVVADRDRDHKNQRLAALQASRHGLRSDGERLPIAIGVADPHVDVWLLDDSVAVRTGLGLSADHTIPNIRRVKDPKAALDDLIRESEWKNDNIQRPLANIASHVQAGRCPHARETGFQRFLDDCLNELK